MIYYKLPSTLNQDIDRFETDIAAFKAGDLHETAFTAKRVKMGVYLERNYETHMCRIRCAGNMITPKQLSKVAMLAKEYGHPRVHVTTRADVQIHNVGLENTPFILRELLKSNLTCKGGGGHTIRNIVTNHDSGVHPDEVFDVQPYAVALTERLISEVDSFELPRKVKTAFSSLEADTANCIIQDLGFIASINDKGQQGFKVYTGGGLGAKPRLGILLHDFIPEDKVYHVAKAIKNVFHFHGNRRNKHRNRIKFLIYDDLGVEKFKGIYQEELEKIYNNDSVKLDIKQIENEANLQQPIDLEPVSGTIKGYETWYKNNVIHQKQKGLCGIKLALHLGDLHSDDCLKLEEVLRPFGDNVLRCGTDQNFYIRNIPEQYLKNVFKVIKTLRTLSDKPFLYGNIVPCTGAQTCQVGINYPRPATDALFKHFEKTGLDAEKLDDVVIRISGCPNSCANHWVGDLAFFGKVRRVGGRPIPTYNVLGGGGLKDGSLKLGKEVGWVHSYDLPRFISEVLNQYRSYKEKTDGGVVFNQYWNAEGKQVISDLCKAKYNQVPLFEDDKNYYFDHGAENIFSIKDMGRAECSAGIYDMIDVDSRAIRKNIKKIELWEKGRKGLGPVLKDTVFFASRMLLITRGEDPNTEQATYNLFLKHFIDTGLVNESHRFIVELVKDEKFCELIEHMDKVVTLGKEIRTLYKQMDNTMRFPGETKNYAIDMEEKTEDSEVKTVPGNAKPEKKKQKRKADRFKDLRGVKCPLNFAQTKVQMATMKSGETLEIILDDGEPIENVPGSVKLDGHIILSQEKMGEHWTLLIEKA